jgi:hypothetical protein
MKSERRHALQTNTLAQGIGALPLFWHKYGTKVLLALVAVLAVVLFVKFQMRSAQQARETAGEAYGTALAAIGTLPRVPAEQRREFQDQANTAIDTVLENAKDGALKAEALFARGELNWLVATLSDPSPTTAGATQPSAKSQQSRDELLDKARQAYEAAIGTSGAKPLTVTSARFGLANIAEERGQWDAARAEYENILNDANAAQAFKEQATLRTENLKRLQRPPLLGKPATLPTTEPTTLPSLEAGPAGPPAPTTTRAGATEPATQAATKPATAPATRP